MVWDIGSISLTIDSTQLKKLGLYELLCLKLSFRYALYLGALRQPFAIASDSVQNHFSPCAGLITVDS